MGRSIDEALLRAERSLAAGRFEEAVRLFEKIPESSPNFGRACKGRGAALLRAGRAAASLSILHIAHEALPDDPDILVNAGDASRIVDEPEIAEAFYKRARTLGADGYQILFGEASLLQQQELWLNAIEAWTEMKRRFPADAVVAHNLGKAWHELGDTDLSISLMLESFEASGSPMTLAMLAILAPHSGGCSHEDVLRWRTEYGTWLRASEGGRAPRKFDQRGATGRVNIGYVSAFFHRSNWMKPVWALLNHHDRGRFKIHLFADGPLDEISAAGGYAAHVQDEVHDVRKLNNTELEALIRRCEIDVLVDLNGYSAPSRLGLWAAKPAPVTVGWFNYYATSGMPGIEWLIGDDVVIRPQEEEYYTERIVRLKQSYLTFQVGYVTPDVEFPSDSGPFTFGCLGSGYKITPEVRDAWIKLLRSTEGTRLLVRNRVLREEGHREWMRSFFKHGEIDPGRITLLGPADHDEFLGTYGQVDIALDTFPYNGGTTTMEAIWQGVPVVCFDGDRWVSRTSATIMTSAGLREFVGASVDDYIKIAARWSSPERRDKLRQIRTGMRKMLIDSPVCDGFALAKDFESIIFEMMADGYEHQPVF